MAEVHGTPEPHVHPGIGGFFQNNTMGLPNWAWLLIIGAGIGAAIIIPKFINNKGSGNATTTGTTPDSGLGLAIDPTTGLPYAVEGLVPAGGVGGTTGTQGPPGPQGPQGQPGTPAPTPTIKIRNRFALGANDPFDKSHPQGANMFNSPNKGNKVTGFLPWGSNVSVVGGPIYPPGEGPGKGEPFYKLSNGMYILAQDLQGLPSGTPHVATNTSQIGATTLSPSWPGDTSQQRIA